MFSLTTCLLAGGRLGVRPPGAAGGTTQYPRDGSSLAVACARNLDKKKLQRVSYSMPGELS